MKLILRSIIFLHLLLFAVTAHSQLSFGRQCEGKWEGMMHIFAHGMLKDSVQVELIVAPLKAGTWTWKTVYLSAKTPMTKDYTLVEKDLPTGKYITDEGDGIQLSDYRFGNKLYSVFETGGVMLTSSYELIGNQLIFEVSSGKKETGSSADVNSYSVDFLQRVVFRRAQ